MEFKDLEIIRSGYEGLHDHIIPSMLKSGEDQLRHRLIPTINPIGWMCWHMLRTEDMFLSNVIFGEDQIFHLGNWQNKLGINTANVGTGMTVAEADELAKQLDLEALKDYNIAVKEHSLKLLNKTADLESDKLDDADIITERLIKADAFPEGVLQERAKAYAPTPVSTCILGLISHAYMHFGQYLVLTKPL